MNMVADNLVELERVEQERAKQANEPFEIPFWLVFRIVESFDEQTRTPSLSLETVHHLPVYKCHQYLDE